MNSQFQSQRGHAIFDYIRQGSPTPATQSTASSSSSAVIPSWIDNMTQQPPRRRRSPVRNTRARDEGWHWHEEVRDAQRAEHTELLEEVRASGIIAARRKAIAKSAAGQRHWTSYREEAMIAAQSRPGQRPIY